MINKFMRSAINRGHRSIVNLLLSLGARINKVDKQGWTPLMHALEAGCPGIVEDFIKAGADPNVRYENGLTALMGELEKGHLEIVKLLLSAGALVDEKDPQGRTALEREVEKGHLESARLLLNAGADPNIADSSGKSLLMQEVEKGHLEIVKILLDTGANPNIVDSSGKSLLMQEVEKGHLEIVKILLDAGANVDENAAEWLLALKREGGESPGKLENFFLKDPFTVLRRKWGEVPAGASRISTKKLLALPDQKLLARWSEIRNEAVTGQFFAMRGWYHQLYLDVFRNRRVLDVGSGLGIDGITFAQQGAKITFVDIVESNLVLIQRLCRLLGLKGVDFCYMKNIGSLAGLRTDYDIIFCQGSLINAPFKMACEEARELLKHLPVGGRWIELAYPKTRWEREGSLPFERWGEKTDGLGTPWIEWYDLDKMLARLAPAEFEVILYFEFHNSDFNWFDLVRRA